MLVAALAAAAQPPMPSRWGEFGRQGSLDRVRETVEIATRTPKGVSPPHFVVRYSYSSPGYRTGTIAGSSLKETDSQTCPAVRAVVASLPALDLPKIAPGGGSVIALDGTAYWLEAPSADPAGRIRITSNQGSALARWIDDALRQLAACWPASTGNPPAAG